MAALAAKARLLEAGDDGVSVFSHLTDVLASILDAGATPETRTEAKTPDAPASMIDDGAHTTRDANAVVAKKKFREPFSSRSVLGSRAFLFEKAFSASPQASRSSHAPATSSHPPDARVAAEGISAWIRAAGTTERRSRDEVQLETSREDK